MTLFYVISLILLFWDLLASDRLYLKGLEFVLVSDYTVSI